MDRGRCFHIADRMHSHGYSPLLWVLHPEWRGPVIAESVCRCDWLNVIDVWAVLVDPNAAAFNCLPTPAVCPLEEWRICFVNMFFYSGFVYIEYIASWVKTTAYSRTNGEFGQRHSNGENNITTCFRLAIQLSNQPVSRRLSDAIIASWC